MEPQITASLANLIDKARTAYVKMDFMRLINSCVNNAVINAQLVYKTLLIASPVQLIDLILLIAYVEIITSIIKLIQNANSVINIVANAT